MLCLLFSLFILHCFAFVDFCFQLILKFTVILAFLANAIYDIAYLVSDKSFLLYIYIIVH